MDQPRPQVSPADVERVIQRDYGPGRVADVLRVLRRYGEEPWEEGRDRVRLAVLKLAAGDLSKLEGYATMAKTDPRDVIAGAEYPRYASARAADLTEEQREPIIAEDWQEYTSWLYR